MLKTLLMAVISAATILLAPTSVRAQSLGSLSDIAQVTILPGWRTEQGTQMAAIRVALAKGWKTYWRSPGDTGIPPRFDWSDSSNLAAVKFYWPRPRVFYTDGFRSIGYKGVTIIPIELTPSTTADSTIKLRAQMELGVCEDVCIPMTVTLDANLTASGQVDATINASLAKLPRTAEQAGVKSAVCTLEPIADGLRLSARINLPKQGKDEVAIIELQDQTIWVASAKTSRRGRYLSATTELVPPSGAPFPLDRTGVRITVLAGDNAVDIQGCSAS
jgi:DsbC/DsbD-like thiol-disulfide interchange protein